SEPGFDKYDTEQTALTAIIEHDLSNDWQLRLASRYSDSHADYHTMYGWPPVLQADNRRVQRLSYVSSANSRALTRDLQVHGSLQTGNIEHKIVAGVDYQHAYTDNAYVYGDGGLLDLYNPVYGQAPLQPTKADVNDLPSATN